MNREQEDRVLRFAPSEPGSAMPERPAPLYQQIKDHIREQIHRGAWAPGRRIPSENQIVGELGVSRMTVNRALRELTQEGCLDRVAGVGRFVAAPPRHASLIALRNIAEEIADDGREHRARIVWQERMRVDEPLAERLEMAVGDTVFHVTLVHLSDKLPIQLEDRWVSPWAAPDFLDVDFTRTTPSEHLLRSIEPEEMEHVVQATLPDAATSELLAIARTEPCLRLERRTWNHGRVVTYAVLTYPSSRYDLGARYKVQQRSGHQGPGRGRDPQGLGPARVTPIAGALGNAEFPPETSQRNTGGRKVPDARKRGNP